MKGASMKGERGNGKKNKMGSSIHKTCGNCKWDSYKKVRVCRDCNVLGVDFAWEKCTEEQRLNQPCNGVTKLQRAKENAQC
jgi:hypothetical protein